MKKSDLMPGDVIELRNGNLYLLFGGEQGNMAGLTNNAHHMSLDLYSEDLQRFGEYYWNKTKLKDWDVVGVYRDFADGYFLKSLIDNPREHLKVCNKVYERKDSPPQKMTVSEIVEALGYDIEIVKG